MGGGGGYTERLAHVPHATLMSIMSTVDKVEGGAELSIFCVVKGYRKCPFKVNVGQTFYAYKKRAESDSAFKI